MEQIVNIFRLSVKRISDRSATHALHKVSLMNIPTSFRLLFRTILMSVILLCAFVACSGCEKKQQIKVGDNAPVFTATDSHGAAFGLDQLKDNVVILFFWTNSCCGDKVKLLEPLYRRNRDKGLAVVAVDVGDRKEVAESYVRAYGLTFTLLTDTNSDIAQQYGIFGFPTIFILGRNGIVREKIHGDISTDILQKLVTKQFTIQQESEANYRKIHPR